MKALIASEDLFLRIDAAYLDCVADNLALLLLHLGHQDVRTPFACQWHFGFDESKADALPVLYRYSLPEIIAEQTGCRVYQQQLDPSNYVDALGALVERGQPVLVFGNAFFIPWLPYFGHASQEHSFIVDGISADRRLVHIADAHENTTEWGKAEPTTVELPSIALPVILKTESEHARTIFLLERVSDTPEIDVKVLLLDNARQIALAHEQGQFRAFADFYRKRSQDVSAAKQFELAIWLIARSRALHGMWLHDVAERRPDLLPHAYPDRYEKEVALPWKRAEGQAYLLIRRVARGRPAPVACFTMIEETIAPQEAALADALLAHL